MLSSYGRGLAVDGELLGPGLPQVSLGQGGGRLAAGSLYAAQVKTPATSMFQHTFIAAHCFPAVDQNKGPYCTSTDLIFGILKTKQKKIAQDLLAPFP